MPSFPRANRPGSLLALVLALPLLAGLASCGGSGGTSSALPPGEPTTAAPGDTVIYVAESKANRIDAFRLGSDGLLPSKPFSSIKVDWPRRLAVADGVLYASLYNGVVSMRLGADGSLPSKPTGASLTRSDYDPVNLEARDGKLYVAAAGILRVESFELDSKGDVPLEAAGSGQGEFPADFASLAFDGDYLYSGARKTEYIDVFLLDADGNVPTNAEAQNPRDNVALPDDLEIRDGVLYVTSGSDRTVHAYRIRPDGLLPADEDSRTAAAEFYSDILLDGQNLYAAAYNAGRIDVYDVDADGMLPEAGPVARTQFDPASYPAKMRLDAGVLYVAQAGLGRIDAYVLDGDGMPPTYPSSSTRALDGSYPLDLVLYRLP